MNYIKQIQSENAGLKNQIKETNIAIQDMISFLHSDKFVGVQSDGSRKDWIATNDVIYKLRDLKLLCMMGWD